MGFLVLSHCAGKRARFIGQGRKRESGYLHAGEMEGGEGAAYWAIYFELEGFSLRNSSLRLNASLFSMGLYL